MNTTVGDDVVISLEEFKKERDKGTKNQSAETKCFNRIYEVLKEEGFSLSIRSRLLQISPGLYRTVVNMEFVPVERKT
ncbi:hypothetical protein KKH23_06130 [Patescibacteria group bacterium]|nr:hypothetical protein [Patescibacteria group bacterium]